MRTNYIELAIRAFHCVGIAAVFMGKCSAELITFESIPTTGNPTEGLQISDQFASSGVRFSLEGGGFPVIAQVGAPTTAFTGPPNDTGSDNPALDQNIGSFFLTDDGQLSDSLISAALIVVYDTPTAAASGVILDIDFDERFTIQLRDAALEILDTIIINASDPNTGDGIATRWSFDRGTNDVHSIRFKGTRTVAGGFGLGFDNFNTRSVPEPGSLITIGIAATLFATRRKRRTRCGHHTLLLLCSMIALLPTYAQAADFLGPSPYLAFDDPAAGAAVSPFKDIAFDYFHLEDFEDNDFDVPGVSIAEFADVGVPTFAASDSVDDDDGVIDGSSDGVSLFSDFNNAGTFTFTFSASTLGRLPTHAGIVWTDVGINLGGDPRPQDLVDNVLFEAFGPVGESLGVIGPFSLGDDTILGTTAEDRFFGAINLAGLSAIKISMPGKNNWEVDHLQYGGAVPEPSTFCIILSSVFGCGSFRRRLP